MTIDSDDIKMTEIQVVEEKGDTMRVYNIVDLHIADSDDPITTIVVDGYEDVAVSETK